MPENTTNPQEQFPSQPLLNRFFMSPADKADREKGKAIVKEFYRLQTSSEGFNFFKGRNVRWTELLLWQKGSQDMKEFLDYLNISTQDSVKSWVNIDMTPSRLGVQFVGTVQESYAKLKAYPCVKAIDDGSLDEKAQRQLEALFRMKEVQTIHAAQQASGLQLEPDNVYVPDDELSAKVYFELEDRLPKEIRFEQLLAKLQKDIRFEEILNPKTLRDLIVLNAGFTKIEKLGKGQYTVRKPVPSNMVFNFFMNDSGELEVDMIGEFYSLKVRDFRSKFGKTDERPEGMAEKEIFELAKLSTNKNIGQFKHVWQDAWTLPTWNWNCPYDDNSIMVLDCEIDCGEDVYYVSKTDSFGREDIQAKKSIPGIQQKKDGTIIQQPLADGTEIIKRQKNTWMRGVYAPYGDKMLYWGRPDIIITPYTNTAKPLSSYSVVIPNNDGEYVPSLFERILEPLREYQTTKLKRKQIIAKLRPSGVRIDVESARNIDLGNGDSISWEEVVRVYDQTGNELWSSKGVDPLQKETPAITPGAMNDDVQKILGLTQTMQGIAMEIRQLIGVPQYRDGADVGDRTAASLQENQNQSSFNVTDFIPRSNNALWQETFYKVCLLHWNDIVKEEPESKEDMLNTRFDISIRMKATDYEKQQLEQDIQRYSQVPDAQGNPSLTLKDAMFIREIMDDGDSKLARWYLTKTYEENRRKAMQESAALQQQNQQLQMQSAQQAQEQAQKLQDDKLAADKEMEEFRGRIEKEKIFLQGYLAACAKDETGNLLKDFMPVVKQILPNLILPIMNENKEMQQGMAQQAMAEHLQQAAIQQQMAQQQQGQPQMQGQQPEEMQEQQQPQTQQQNVLQ